MQSPGCSFQGGSQASCSWGARGRGEELVALEKWEHMATSSLLGEASQGWLGLEPTAVLRALCSPGKGKRAEEDSGTGLG